MERLAPTIGLNVAKLDGRKPTVARDLTGTPPRPPTVCPPCPLFPLHDVLIFQNKLSIYLEPNSEIKKILISLLYFILF